MSKLHIHRADETANRTPPNHSCANHPCPNGTYFYLLNKKNLYCGQGSGHSNSIIAGVGEKSGISESHMGMAALLESQKEGSGEAETAETKGPGAPEALCSNSEERCGLNRAEHTSTA